MNCRREMSGTAGPPSPAVLDVADLSCCDILFCPLPNGPVFMVPYCSTTATGGLSIPPGAGLMRGPSFAPELVPEVRWRAYDRRVVGPEGPWARHPGRANRGMPRTPGRRRLRRCRRMLHRPPRALTPRPPLTPLALHPYERWRACGEVSQDDRSSLCNRFVPP